jgi:hypothetical protein
MENLGTGPKTLLIFETPITASRPPSIFAFRAAK